MQVTTTNVNNSSFGGSAQHAAGTSTNNRQDLSESVVNRVCDFFVVVIHLILYLHQVYPARMFGMRNYEGVCVYMCRHPDVMKYITRTVGSIREWVMKGQVQSMTIVIFKVKTRAVIARYVYDIQTAIISNVHTTEANNSTGDVSDAQLALMDTQLRAHITRLMAVGGGRNVKDLSISQNASCSNEQQRVQGVHQDDEISFDVLVATAGIQSPVDWVDVNGKEIWGMDNAIATPIKDGDSNSLTISITSRLEREQANDQL